MAPDYLLFTFGYGSSRHYAISKRVEGNPNPYASVVTAGHRALSELIRTLVHGTDCRLNPKDVGTIDSIIHGIEGGITLEPVDAMALELFRQLYRIERELAPIKRQVMAKAVQNN